MGGSLSQEGFSSKKQTGKKKKKVQAKAVCETAKCEGVDSYWKKGKFIILSFLFYVFLGEKQKP